jgi:hypothetical protein
MLMAFDSRLSFIGKGVIVCCLILISPSHVPAEDLRIDIVNASRCRVRCLSLLQVSSFKLTYFE